MKMLLWIINKDRSAHSRRKKLVKLRSQQKYVMNRWMNVCKMHFWNSSGEYFMIVGTFSLDSSCRSPTKNSTQPSPMCPLPFVWNFYFGLICISNRCGWSGGQYLTRYQSILSMREYSLAEIDINYVWTEQWQP